MLNISPQVEQKLWEKHRVTPQEVYECFLNHTSHFMEDTREEHGTWPPSEWFISETDHRRVLKVVFIYEDDNTITVKTAYEPSKKEKRIYAAARWNF